MWTGGCCLLSGNLHYLFNPFFHVHIWRFDWVGFFFSFVRDDDDDVFRSCLVPSTGLDLTWI